MFGLSGTIQDTSKSGALLTLRGTSKPVVSGLFIQHTWRLFAISLIWVSWASSSVGTKPRRGSSSRSCAHTGLN
jgi:hypothetical protein